MDFHNHISIAKRLENTKIIFIFLTIFPHHKSIDT